MATKTKTTAQAMIKVMQYGSPIRRDSRQREYLKSLGLRRINDVRELQDSPSVRSLITRLQHMVKIVEG